MQQRILTLCEQCRAELEAGYAVKTYSCARPTTQMQKKCQRCQKSNPALRMYIIDKKRD